jgi:excisionase family DNA binding protein
MTTRYLTVKEAAALLKVSRDTIRSWINTGSLVSVNLATRGKRPCFRISTEELESFLRRRQVKERPVERSPRYQQPDWVIDIVG